VLSAGQSSPLEATVNDTFVAAPILVAGVIVGFWIAVVIAGITLARYVVRRWER